MGSVEQLKLLVNLAKADGEVAEKEKQYIINIGQANHLLVAEILPLFSQTHDVIIPENLSPEEKFEYLLRLIQLMKIDEKLYQSEIKFCAQVASRLGYRQEVLVNLMLNVRNVPMDANEMDALRQMTSKFLQSI